MAVTHPFLRDGGHHGLAAAGEGELCGLGPRVTPGSLAASPTSGAASALGSRVAMPTACIAVGQGP